MNLIDDFDPVTTGRDYWPEDQDKRQKMGVQYHMKEKPEVEGGSE